MQSEMDDSYELVLSTRLEKCVFDIWEWNLDVDSFGWRVSHTIFVDFKVTDGSSAFEIWLDSDVLENISFALDQLDWLKLILSILLLLIFLVNDLRLLNKVFDLFLDQSQVIVFTTIVLVLES